MPVTEGVTRRQCIPIVYTRGTHYEVGYDVMEYYYTWLPLLWAGGPKNEFSQSLGNPLFLALEDTGRTFATLIHGLVETSTQLNEKFLPAFETVKGKKAYDDTLDEVKKNFPQYVRELEGTADGAKVPFYKLFLLHMDVITPTVIGREGKTEAIGCSTICVNQQNQEILGHTEDALTEVLNHFYFVSAHIISDKPQGRWGVTEERFTSLCYAGHLPGYTMNYNHHGLVFSINTLGAVKLQSGKTPRHFLTRALLAAENFEQAREILRDSNIGAADGCSVNMSFLYQGGDRLFHNIEMAPAEEQPESQLNILSAGKGENIIHCNSYLRLHVEEVGGLLGQSSNSRLKTLSNYPPPTSKQDVIQMLGDQSGEDFRVFQEFGPHDIVKTIAVGIFDCIERTWSIYADNPRHTAPLVVLPLVLKKQVGSK